MSVQSLLEILTIRTVTMREMIAVLIARSAADTADPMEAFKQISNGLNKRIDEKNPEFMSRVPVELVA